MVEEARYLLRINDPEMLRSSFDIVRLDPDDPRHEQLVYEGEDSDLADWLFAQGFIRQIVDEGDVPGLVRNYAPMISFKKHK